MAAVLGIVAMGIDGVTSYANLRSTTNDIRQATGLAAGAGLAVFLVPMFNYQVWRQSAEKPILARPWTWLGMVAVLAAAFLLVRAPGGWMSFLPTLVGLLVVAVFTLVNLLIITIIPWFQQRADKWWQLLPHAAAGFALAAIELWMSAEFHAYALSWAQRLRG